MCVWGGRGVGRGEVWLGNPFIVSVKKLDVQNSSL